MLTVFLSGLIQGIYYALISLGLVLVYRHSRILNFAHAAIATFSAFIAYTVLKKGGPYWMAATAAIAAGILVSLVVERLVVRPLSRKPGHVAAIGTIAASLIIIGAVAVIFGTTQVALPPAVGQELSLSLGSMVVGGNQVLAVITTVALVGVLLLVLEFTHLGIALRAVSEGPLTAQLLGVNVRRLGQVVWGVAGALGAIAALVITPENYLDPAFLTDFMIAAFVAVVLGGLESIVGVVLGGILFGIASAFFSYFVTERLANSFAFVSILIVLFVLPYGLLGQSSKRVNEPILHDVSRWHWKLLLPLANWLPQLNGERTQWACIAAALLVTVAAPAILPEPYLYTLAMVAVMFLATTSQNFVAGYSGQFSVGQSGFLVVGGYAAVLLQLHLGLSFIPAVLLAAAVSGAVGFLLALPVARLSGVYLALLTIAFALAMPELVAFPGELTGGGAGLQTPPIHLPGLEIIGTIPLYWLSLGIVWVLFFVLRFITTSPIARSWTCIRDSEAGAAAIGFNVQWLKISVFSVGAAVAGVAGALSVTLVGYLSPENFTLWTSFFLLVAVIVGGSGSLLGSLIGSAFIVLMPVLFAGIPQVPQIAYGLVLLVFLLLAPEGIAAGLLRRRVPGGANASILARAAERRA